MAIRNWHWGKLILLWVVGIVIDLPFILKVVLENGPMFRSNEPVWVIVFVLSVLWGTPLFLLVVTWKWLSGKEMSPTDSQKDESHAGVRGATRKRTEIMILVVILLVGIALFVSYQQNPKDIKTAKNNPVLRDQYEEIVQTRFGQNIRENRLQNVLGVIVQEKGTRTLKLRYENKSNKDIRGFKGDLMIKDLFGDIILVHHLREDKILKATQSLLVDRSITYVGFPEGRQRLNSVKLEELKITWAPDTIVFTDGETLSRWNRLRKEVPEPPNPYVQLLDQMAEERLRLQQEAHPEGNKNNIPDSPDQQ